MEMNLTQFESLNLYSNSNMEKLVANIVNKSSNAVLINMYEDSVVLLDHETGSFYVADYKFDREKLSLKLENFEEVDLVKESEDFRDKVLDFFEDEDASVTDLVESYKSDVLDQDRFLNELINGSMARKDFNGIVDYSAIKEAVESTVLSSINESFFGAYKERLSTHPLNEVKFFNWEESVTVSLVETESKKVVNRSAVARANDLWKKDAFKKKFENACATFVEDVEEGADELKGLFEEYPQVFFLDGADRRALFGKSLLSSKTLREGMDDILKGLDLMFEKFDLADLRATYLSEAGEEEGAAAAPAEGGEEAEAEEPKELEADDKTKLLDDLKKVAEKVENEEAKKALDAIIEKMEKGLEEGTRPELVKEAVAILSL